MREKIQLVFVGGFAHPRDAFAPIAESFANTFNVMLLSIEDLVGESQNTPEREASGEVSNYAQNLIEKLNEEMSIIIAWSMGGMLALEAASLRPDLISKLVLFASTARFTNEENSSAAYSNGLPISTLKVMKRSLVRNKKQMLLDFFTRSYANDISESVLCSIVEQASLVDSEVLSDSLTYLERADIRPLLSQVKAETLIFHGEQDEIIPIRAARFLVEQLPSATLESVVDGAHAVFASDERQLAERIQGFISNE